MAKMKQVVFSELLSNPKNGIIYFEAQTKGRLATSEPNGKTVYGPNLAEVGAKQTNLWNVLGRHIEINRCSYQAIM